MEFHKTCRSLSIYNFTELVKSGDLRFLLKEFDEFESESISLSEEQKDILSKTYKDIIYEHSELTANNKILANYKTKFIIDTLEFRYRTTFKILMFYVESLDIEILSLLNKLEWSFDPSEDIDSQLNVISTSMKGLRTRIDILIVKYKAKFEIEDESKESSNDFNINRLDNEAITLELNLKLGYSIDTRKTTVSKWISMWNISNKRNSELNNKVNGNS